MKILAIRIKNLASLEGITEIDFTQEPLASAGIFAITGPTGAGKSTILDALCLALYGKTPRYLQAKENGIEIYDVEGTTISQDSVRGILRKGTSDGFAEVEFVGTDNQNYRATWSVRRARNKAEGSLQPDTISLKNTTENLDLPGKKTETLHEIERLVGLNFEQFTRSVLLAQGDFTAFMKANKDEKSSLLEKLTGTQIYSEISKKIFENSKYQEQLLRDLNIRKAGIVVLSEEDVAQINLQEQDLTEKIALLANEMTLIAKEIQWHEQVKIVQGNVTNAIENAEKTKQILLQSEDRKANLLQIEQVQNTRSWHDAFVLSTNQLTEQNVTLIDLQKKSSALELQKELLEQQIVKENETISEAKEWQKEALPKVAEAKKLDTLLVEKEKQKETATSEKNEAQTQLENHQKEIASLKEEINRVETEIKTIQDWQTKFDNKKGIALNKEVIVSKLTDAEKIATTVKTSATEQNALNEKIASSTTELTAVEHDFDKLNIDFEHEQKRIQTQSDELILLPIEQWQMEKEATDQMLTSLLEGQSIWNILYQLDLDISALRQKQAVEKADFAQKTERLQQLKKELEQHFIAKETSGEGLQKARLAASENVENLRATLQENEPCVVCGSTEHPYKVHHPQLEKVLLTLEELHQKNEKNYLTSFGESERLSQELKQLETLFEKQSAEMNAKEALFLGKKQQWNSHSISVLSETVSNAEKTTWMDAELKSLKAKQNDFQLKIKTHSEQRKHLENAKYQLEKVKEKKDVLKDVQNDLSNQVAIFKQKLESVNTAISQANLALAEIKNNLNSYFTTTDWMEKWMEKPPEFVVFVTQFAQEWQLKSAQLEAFKNQNNIWFSTLSQLINQEKSLAETLSKKATFEQQINSELVALTLNRKNIFDGIAAEIIEEKATKAVEEAQKKAENTQQLLQQNRIDLATATTSYNEISNAKAKLIVEQESIRLKIENWLTDFNDKFQVNFTLQDLENRLTFTAEWIESERKILQGFADEATKAASVLLERQQILEQHLAQKPSDRTLDAIQLLFEKVKFDHENASQTKANLGFQLREDQLNKLKIGDLLKEIAVQAKTTDEWSKLNEMIGSADGKKFRQIAQEYTLDVLLQFANLHLQVLTSRYKMERIPNTLGLQVVDVDMGDEIRTVYSLSGGESFLVSLALALGLASLSSSKMKVESLFIDEGFGSLDPNTLNIAMDALERLHNQGRKVGVISHVQEMTERIPVQIKVSKKSSGRSLVEVVEG